MPQARKHRPTLTLQPKASASPSSAAATPARYAQFAKRLAERRQTLREEIHATLLRADAERYADIADRINDIEDRPLAELLAEVSHAEVARDVEEVRLRRGDVKAHAGIDIEHQSDSAS